MNRECQLIRRVVDREQAAEREFVTCFRGLILGLARGRFGLDVEAAEEILQMTITRLWEDDHRALRAWRGQGKFSTYLSVIVCRLCLHQREQAQRQADRTADSCPEPVAEALGSHRLTAREHHRAIGQSLAKLRPRDRLLLALRYFDEHSPGEISTLLGNSPGAIRKAVHDALKRLRQELRQRHPELFDAASAGTKKAPPSQGEQP